MEGLYNIYKKVDHVYHKMFVSPFVKYFWDDRVLEHLLLGMKIMLDTKDVMHIGACNWDTLNGNKGGCPGTCCYDVEDVRNTINIMNTTNTTQGWPKYYEILKENGIGNCGEHSFIASYIGRMDYGINSYRLSFKHYDHVVTVIDPLFDKRTDIVVDAWDYFVCPRSVFRSVMFWKRYWVRCGLKYDGYMTNAAPEKYANEVLGKEYRIHQKWSWNPKTREEYVQDKLNRHRNRGVLGIWRTINNDGMEYFLKYGKGNRDIELKVEHRDKIIGKYDVYCSESARMYVSALVCIVSFVALKVNPIVRGVSTSFFFMQAVRGHMNRARIWYE